MFPFSGGNEDVLVNWRLDSTNKQRLPYDYVDWTIAANESLIDC